MNSNDSARFYPSFIFRLIAAISAAVILSSNAAFGQQARDYTAKALAAMSAPRDYTFENERLIDSINRVAHSIKLNIVFHLSSLSIVTKPNAITVLHNISAPDAIDALLQANGLVQYQLDRRAVMVVDQNHTRGPIATIQTVITQAIEEEGREPVADTSLRSQPELRTVDVVFRNATLAGGIENLAAVARLKVTFDKTIEYRVRFASLDIDLRDVTEAQALRYMLDAFDLKYEEVTGDTINIVGENHQHSSTPLEEIIKKAAMKGR